MITGETGVGKELIARALHTLSTRAGAFVPVNVAGLDDNVFSDTLFGHRKGAFTGADEARAGLIVRASGGTLFLDEIGDLSSASQVKLLRLLQENEYFPLGADVPKEANVRVIAATNRDVKDLRQKGGNFRQDLFYRLCSHHVQIPPLRERIGDLPLLCEHFLAEAASTMHKAIPNDLDTILTVILSHDFPGNIRELQSLLSNAVSSQSFDNFPALKSKKASLSSGLQISEKTTDNLIFAGHLPTLDRADAMLIDEAMRRSGGNQTLAAKMIGISRQTLIRYLKKEQNS